MKLRLQLVLFAALLFIGTKASSAQEIKTYTFNELEPLLHYQNDTTYVINFWAMWCKPCVEELPEFEEVRKAYSEQKVKVILVSLDFGSHLEERLSKFLERKHVHSEVVVLDDPDANSWINKVNEKWDGALPATVIYKNNQRKFFNHRISYKVLVQSINEMSKH